MIKRIALLLALLIALSGISVLVSSPAQALRCTSHYTTDYDYVTERARGWWVSKWRVMQETRFNNCVDGNRRWADPVSTKYGCRQVENTGFIGLRYVQFNTRFWDRDHHELNPRAMRLGCKSKQWTTKYQFHRDVTKLHRCGTGGPRFDTSVKFDIAAGDDAHTRLASAFWGYVGPMIVRC
jgi:hypothetical protein